ncbi:M16 family metallopeptidase [Tunicatimonas pelagia]|uniref:M16 family metallopeptidase n=1 Tax=Tunicatimonas pelagia TaxID=931531 RepID=UPI002666F483|nr:pitrilysin family protein [Tunicatimonas pelagia]WKN42480.1 pitrilysin family protein [Tunicatimonas pelagia]
MIDFNQFKLSNGLQVLVHTDPSVPIATVNVLYNVGSRDEDENKTGFAHLFEHLMFGGSKNIPSYDEPLQLVGGENNAFTNPDITNYFLTLPVTNLETAFWLESDRMLSLSFDPKVLEVQRKVVIEEYKQNYLNQPYGDAMMTLKALAYQTHPYRWPTIGRDISHIEQATLDDVKSFFYKFYRPNNAVLVVAGQVEAEEVKQLAEKWFGDIPAGEPYHRQLPQEAEQTEPRHLKKAGDVPAHAIYKAFHIPGRTQAGYHAADLLSDILGRSRSSRLFTQLVKENPLFSSINAYVTGSVDPGLLIIHGRLNEGVTLEAADEAITSVIEEVKEKRISGEELRKVKNQAESTLVFSEMELLNRAMSLAFSTLLGDPNLINQESAKIQAVTAEDIQQSAQKILSANNSSTLFYEALVD